MRLKLIFPILILALNACAPAPASKLATDAVSRRILGSAVTVPLAAHPDQEAITQSLTATRALAWETFAKVVTDAERNIPGPDGKSIALEIPRVFTWYSPEDVNRLLGFSLKQLSPDQLDLGLSLSSSQWTESQLRLDNELETLPTPLLKKWSRFFEGAVDRSTVIGATGLNRTLFSPDLIGSVAQQYADLQNCFPGGQKPLPEEPFHSCWPKALPRSSVTIKTNWINSQSTFRKVVTNDISLPRLMTSQDADWDSIKVEAPLPSPEKIVTAQINGKAFVLSGIHIVSKELDDWLWISAWWSDDPDSDFGEDRPESVKKLGAPWNQYKICAVSSFVQNAAELDSIALTHPTLAAAYRAVLDESGTSWCSNPYIEKGVNNQKTNCIGCHQFAGTDITQEEVISNSERFPQFGKTKQRTDFPSDYIWSATEGQISWLATLNTLRFPSHSQD